MTFSKKFLFIIILNTPIIFNIFAQPNLEVIENYASNLRNQNPSTKNGIKIAKWLNKKLDICCQYYTDEEAMARQRTSNDTLIEPIYIRDCANTKLMNYSKEEEIAAIAHVIQNYPTKQDILKALISDEKAEQATLDARVKFYNTQQQTSEDYIHDIWGTDTRPRWLKNKFIQYMTSPLSDDESTIRFIDH